MDKASIEYPLNLAAQWLVLVGALAWGAIACCKVNPVEVLIPKAFLNYVYGLVGVSAAYLILCRFR
jgi:uncharacterized membrane protein YuzA (DUF378 family)